MHMKNQPYNVGSGSDLMKNGRSADSLVRLNRYAPVLRSYCDKGDPICANGDDVNVHLSYFEKYTDDAANWAVGKLNAAAPLCAAPTPTPSASSSVVASVADVASSTAVASSGASSTVVASVAGVASSTAVASGASSTVVASVAGVASSAAAGVASSAAAGVASSAATGSSGAVASHSVVALPPYPTSPVHVAPFPAPQPYEDVCIPIVDIKYVYV
jgi:hypothetical protein